MLTAVLPLSFVSAADASVVASFVSAADTSAAASFVLAAAFADELPPPELPPLPPDDDLLAFVAFSVVASVVVTVVASVVVSGSVPVTFT